MNYKNIIGIVVLVVLGWAAFTLLEVDQGELTPDADQSQDQNDGEPREGWVAYTNAILGFSLVHPEGMEIREGQGDVSFVFIGETQSEGTEIFDGIALNVRNIVYETSLEDFINQEMQQADDMGEILEPIKSVNIAGRNGFSYTASVLGIYHNIFIDLGNKQAMAIAYINPDPQNKGYQATTNEILSSFTLTAN